MARVAVEQPRCDFCGSTDATSYAILGGTSRREVELCPKHKTVPFNAVLDTARPVKAASRDGIVLIPKAKLLNSLKD